MDQEMHNDNAGAAWPELSADLNLSRVATRSISLDTLRANADGRILEVTAQVDVMRTRLSLLERQVFDASVEAKLSTEHLEGFAYLGAELESSATGFEGLATRIAVAEERVTSTALSSGEDIDARFGIVEDARLSQSAELNELTGYLEQAFSRITELATLIEEERGANATVRGESSEQIGNFSTEVDARIADVTKAVTSLTARMNEASSSIDGSATAATEALFESVADLETRVSTSESRLDQVDEVATSIRFLSARAEALEQAQENAAAHLDDHVEGPNGRIDEARAELEDLESVEHTEQHVIALRGELESALQRIVQLEAEAASPLTAVASTTVSDLAAEFGIDADDADDDTGWLTESYARKNAGSAEAQLRRRLGTQATRRSPPAHRRRDRNPRP
ncbi:MAG: DNA repair exonuclease SbcCD ATPase subunit [Verrucomicrobiales bacterium]|jgi:DNA repair exonuclease SbcCD ATPase subunit